ncbi:MAG: mobile mystery protein A [Acidimicrobiia bacterium]
MARRSTNARRQLDARLSRLRPFADEPRPHRGWIKAIRESLGMSTTELAARMGISQSRIPAIERGEVSGSIRLDTLQRAAEALDCRLVYALVPRSTLDESVHRQARKKAAVHVAAAAHNMRLEDQTVSESAADDEVEDLAVELVDRRGLWTETLDRR